MKPPNGVIRAHWLVPHRGALTCTCTNAQPLPLSAVTKMNYIKTCFGGGLKRKYWGGAEEVGGGCGGQRLWTAEQKAAEWWGPAKVLSKCENNFNCADMIILRVAQPFRMERGIFLVVLTWLFVKVKKKKSQKHKMLWRRKNDAVTIWKSIWKILAL